VVLEKAVGMRPNMIMGLSNEMRWTMDVPQVIIIPVSRRLSIPRPPSFTGRSTIAAVSKGHGEIRRSLGNGIALAYEAGDLKEALIGSARLAHTSSVTEALQFLSPPASGVTRPLAGQHRGTLRACR